MKKVLCWIFGHDFSAWCQVKYQAINRHVAARRLQRVCDYCGEREIIDDRVGLHWINGNIKP